MDAADRKNAWINLEDEFWEVEARWKWLQKKVKNNKIDYEISKNSVENKTQEDIKDNNISNDKCSNKEIRENDVGKEREHERECSVEEAASSSAFMQYCQDVYDAIQQTTKTMSMVKKLMWNIWENETICESFYDAIQFSQQLLENLSTSWSIAFSLFRAQELDLLYKTEKLVSQSTNAHQMSLKFVMSCWQTYLAAHCHSWTARLNHARTKVKDSGHTVGQVYAKAIVSSHALTVAISKGLQTLTAKELQTSNLIPNGNGEEFTVDQNCLIVFGPQPKSKALREEVENESQNPTVGLSLMKVSSDKSIDPHDRNGQEEMKSSPCSISDDEELTESPKGSYGELSDSGERNPNSRNQESVPALPGNRRSGNKASLLRAKYQGMKGFVDNAAKNRLNGPAPARGEVHNHYNPTQQYVQKLCCTQSLHKPFSKPPGTGNKKKQRNGNESGNRKCKCCCENKREESGTEASSSSSSSTSLSSSEEEGKDFSSPSNCVTVTSGSQPEFKIRDWESLMIDIVDLRNEWENLAENLSSDNLEEKLVSELITDKQKDNSSFPLEVEETRMEADSGSLRTVLNELISAMKNALDLSTLEIETHIKAWKERETRNELQLHMKGFDPNEALLQAKSFLFQLMQSFFAMLLLTAADNRRRVLCYASLLPESIAESRKFAYSLILSREISSLKRVYKDQLAKVAVSQVA